LLPLISKIMEQVVHKQLKAYVDRHNVLNTAQHGFRSKRSCGSALLEISNKLSRAKNDGLFSVVAALDYTRAFDTINHKLLLQKLAVFCDVNALAWFSSYLTGRRHFVNFNGAQSELLSTSLGVPQGSKMGPTLFLLYINDLFSRLPPESVVAYADDITLFSNREFAVEAARAMQCLLETACV
jgi:retron-type reverse transcriptase